MVVGLERVQFEVLVLGMAFALDTEPELVLLLLVELALAPVAALDTAPGLGMAAVLALSAVLVLDKVVEP